MLDVVTACPRPTPPNPTFLWILKPSQAEELGQKLVKLKNPWAQLRWKGDYSPGDEKHWTPELRKVLRCALNPKSSPQL